MSAPMTPDEEYAFYARPENQAMATKLVVAAVSMIAVMVLALSGCSPLQRPKADQLEPKATAVFAQVPSASASPASTSAKSVSTDWYGLGQEFTATAVKDGITPTSLEGDPANHWDASRPAFSWCADLSYPVTGTLPANLGALLAQLQASESGQGLRSSITAARTATPKRSGCPQAATRRQGGAVPKIHRRPLLRLRRHCHQRRPRWSRTATR